jgi:hypothetical protein
MTVNFASLLGKTVTEEAKRPPSLPAGTYHGIIQKWEPGESQQKKTPYVRMHVQLLSAGEDVPADQLEGIDFSKKQLRRDYFLTEDAMFRLHEFLKAVGIEFVGKPLGEALQEVIGKQVIADVAAKMNQQDPSQPPFNEITNLRADENA